MDLKNKLKRNAQALEKQIGIILKNWSDEVKDINPQLLPLIDEFIKSNKGGKKLRGFLVRLGFEIASSKFKVQSEKLESNEILNIAVAYEILHTSILAHDDIMDQDIERRGQPSLYKALGGDHYGVSQAISLADAGFFLSLKVLSESKFEDKLKNQALQLFAKTMLDTAVGQMLDVNMQVQSSKFKVQNKEDIVKTINLLKTARYTISGPLKIGAILASADEKLINLLDSFGENLGIAYQIRDDILDGDLPVGRQELNPVESAKVKVLEYTVKARSFIPKITKDAKYDKLLQDLTEYLVERSK